MPALLRSPFYFPLSFAAVVVHGLRLREADRLPEGDRLRG
jgi:hypothetical protein